MKNESFFKYIIALFSLLLISYPFYPSIAIAENEEDRVTIDRFPHEELFQVFDTKPGDSAYRTLLLQNNHEEDIVYTMQIRNDWIKDSKNPARLDLYPELLLKIMDENEVLFDGKLKEFSGVIDRPLASNTEEEIGYEIKFPEELGNEYQGAWTNFSLVFIANLTEETGLVAGISTNVGSGNGSNVGAGGMGSGTSVKGVSTTEGSSLPQTATNMFTYLLIGGLLIATGGIIVYLNKREKDFAFNLHTLKTFIKFKE